MGTKILALSALALGVAACSNTPSENVAATQAEIRSGQFCGGIAGIPCPDGYSCVDDPSDSCDPRKGGADCGGICVKRGPACKYNKLGYNYVGKSADECQVIRFLCPVGQDYFSDNCGCGCRDTGAAKCNYGDPTLNYVAKDPTLCAATTFLCAEGTTGFFNECGCGCQTLAPCTSEECGPAPASPNYLCSDGVTVAGPGDCVRNAADGTCGWQFISCPAA